MKGVSDEAKTVAVLGLGAMGSRMARRLIDAGMSVRLYNRTPGPAERVHGGVVATSPRAAAEGADVVISVVTDDEAARAVWLHPERGALLGLGPRAIAVESSTVTPAWVEALDRAVTERGTTLVDAPVVGSRPQAEAGQLVHLAGGSVDAIATVTPVLAAIGQRVHHVGPVGHGTAMKLVVNALFGMQVAALAEMLGFATRSGIDQATALEILAGLPTTSPALAGIGAAIGAGRFDPLFPIALVAKDFRYATEAAGALEARVPLTEVTARAFADAVEAGLGEQNINALARRYS